MGCDCWRFRRANRLNRLLRYLLDEEEFLSPFGIRSLSKYHEKHPFEYQLERRDSAGAVPAR